MHRRTGQTVGATLSSAASNEFFASVSIGAKRHLRNFCEAPQRTREQIEQMGADNEFGIPLAEELFGLHDVPFRGDRRSQSRGSQLNDGNSTPSDATMRQ